MAGEQKPVPGAGSSATASTGGGEAAGTGTSADDREVGRLAVERKFITPDQLEEAVAEQRRERDSGNELLLGQILVRREWLRVDDLIRLVAEQKARSATVPQISRYEIRERLGEGTTAIVYRGWDRQLNRGVAVKVLRESVGLSEVARQRFRREAEAAAGLSHPNVVTVHDAGEAQGRLYLVMELVEGRPLSQVLRDPSVDERRLVEIVEKAARGLSAAHAKGIVHRDLKPANILVTPQGEPKVSDFGLAHFVDSEAELTRTGTALGTPLYMSPEQVRGDSKAITPQTDVFALGSILYEAATGIPPHAGESLREIYEKIVREDPVLPRRLRPKLSTALQTIILKALDKDPLRRYPTALALADDLGRYLNGEPIEAQPPSGLSLLLRKAVKHRLIVIPAAAAVLGALGGAWAIARFEARPAAVRADPLEPGQPELSEAYRREWARAVPLLPAVDVNRDDLKGDWRLEGGALVCGSAPFTKMQFPVRPPEEYDLLIVCKRREGVGDVNVLLNRLGRPFLWVMGAHGNAVFGFAMVNGKWADANPTTRNESSCLTNGEEYTVVVQVRKEGVWAYLNGRLKSGWRTSYQDLGGDTAWSLPDSTKIGLGTYESPTEFRRVDLLEITGRMTRDR